ncbi:MAG: hypothetical protein M3R50_12960, partial [Bacteroidota bacterium]|nr:hypothetical protein [Bacteroidota bacterium]
AANEIPTVYIVNISVVVIINSISWYLAGMEINFEGGLNARGFTYTNPNASSTCGCGTSFGV